MQKSSPQTKALFETGPNHSGRKTKVVTKSDRRHGHVSVQPFRYIHGHTGASVGMGPNRFKLRRGTAVIFLERQDGAVLECLVSPEKILTEQGVITGTRLGVERRRSTQLHGLMVRTFACTNTSVLVGRGLTTRTATAWTIAARIFVEREGPIRLVDSW